MNEPTLWDNPQICDNLEKYHNTTSLSGTDLKEHRFRAGRLNRRVLTFFQTHSYENYTAWEVWKALGVNNRPKSSVQRAMTDLTPEYLTKLDGKEGRPLVQRPGEWKELCFARILK